MNGLVLDPDTGRVALTRSQLAGLADHVSGRSVAEPLLEDLRRAGAVGDDGPHPLLVPLLRTMATIRGRGILRRWVGGVRPVAEILVGAGGVVVLPGGPDPDARQELRWHPRPTAVARVVAELLGLPADDWTPPFDDRTRPWADLVDAACDPEQQIGLADLRWSAGFGRTPASVLVLAWRREGGGIVEVTPAEPEDDLDEPGETRLIRCRPRHPLEVWTGLTELTRRLAPTVPPPRPR